MAVLLSAAAASSLRAQAEVSAGYDLFATDPSSTDLLGIPFVGDAGAKPTFDFVAPPVSADGRRAIGDTDTIVHRLEDASVDAVPGTADPIAIEVVLLRLVSTVEFDVDGDGDDDGLAYVTLQKDRDPTGEERLNLDAVLPEDVVETVLPGPRSFGEMTITFLSATGGTFDSRLDIFADLRIGAPDGPIVCGESAGLPPCSDFDAGLTLESTDTPWTRDTPPESIAIRGVNFSLAAPDRSAPVDTSLDFWAGIDTSPETPVIVCVDHLGHPDPGGAPTAHGTCCPPCTPDPIAPISCRNDRDDTCDGLIDECEEDLFGPVVTAPDDQTFECPQDEAGLGPDVTGFATATDNCFPPVLPADSIDHADFRTDGCGLTFLIDRVWTATDDCGNAAAMPDLQQIHVVDTTHPSITCPEDTRILWTVDRSPATQGSADGADTCGDVSIDWVDDPDPGVCRSVEITRTWKATDECDLETPCDQFIDVRGPKDAIEDLTAFLLGLGLPQGIENGLSSTLANAVDSACAGNESATLGQLGAFLSLVQAQSGHQIDPADAAELEARAQAIVDAILDPDNGGVCPDGCGGGGDDDDDDGDACPDSDTSPTVVIDGCVTGVDNLALEDGCTILDRIGQCVDDAGTHGDFVTCVRDLAEELFDAGLISRSERRALHTCAAQADLPRS